MTTVQKIIKYLALACAVAIIVNIISAIILASYTLMSVLGIVNDESNELSSENKIIAEVECGNTEKINSLDVSLEYSNLEIKKGDKLFVETNSDYIKCKQNENNIIIEEKHHNWFNKKKVDNLVIYIPDDTTFEKVKIENGAGEINIQNINSKKMNLEIGAGKVEIENLNITDKIDIDGGAGEVKILSGIINDFDLDMGVGKFSITTRLTGKSEIDAGIGSIDINLTDNVENYKFMVSKGIGKITLNNKELQNDSEYGNGNNFLRIDGGIGDINIETNNNLGSNI